MANCNKTSNVEIVKTEVNNSLCNSCLSQDRTLTTIKANSELFMYLLGQDCYLHFQDPDSIFICWECAAILRKIRRFQSQVQHAQILLQRSLYLETATPLKALSNLCISKIERFDLDTNNLENVQPVEEIKRIETVLDEVCAPSIPVTFELPITNVKEEIGFDDTHDYLEETDLVKLEDNNIVPFTSKPNPNVKPEHSKKTKKKKKGKNKFNALNKYGKIIKNKKLDLNNYQESFYLSTLSESEIEKLGQYVGDETNLKIRKSLYCAECKIVFDTTLNKRRHTTFCHILKQESPGPYKCLECSTACTDRAGLKEHWNIHNNGMACTVCGEIVHGDLTMKAHAGTHAVFYRCKLCSDIEHLFWSEKDFFAHYRQLHRHCTCHYCGKRSKSKQALAKHIKNHHLPPICHICKKTYKDSASLNRHIADTHPELLDKKVDPELTYCVECDKHFNSEAKYKKHLKSAMVHIAAVKTPKKVLVPCPECGKQFTRTNYMNNHYKLFHKKETQHYCDICDKYLVSAWAMKIHVLRVHQKIREPKSKICDLCGRGFQTNAILTKHRRTHTGERPYKCAHCPSAFTQSSALKTHARTQHCVV